MGTDLGLRHRRFHSCKCVHCGGGYRRSLKCVGALPFNRPDGPPRCWENALPRAVLHDSWRKSILMRIRRKKIGLAIIDPGDLAPMTVGKTRPSGFSEN